MTQREVIQSAAAPRAVGPYSQAVRAGDHVFTAGQVGVDPTSGALADGVSAQAERALQNLAAILEAAGTRLDRVVKATIFLVDMADFAAVNEAYAVVFSAPYPARSTIAVRGLPLGARVEIECIALAGDTDPA